MSQGKTVVKRMELEQTYFDDAGFYSLMRLKSEPLMGSMLNLSVDVTEKE